MKVLALRIAVNAVALWAAASLVDGIELSSGIGPVLIVAIVFGIVNALLKPIAFVLSLPAILLTLGLFILVVNAAMLGLTAALTDSLDIEDFSAAVLGAIIISIVSWALSTFIPDNEERPQSRDRRADRGP